MPNFRRLASLPALLLTVALVAACTGSVAAPASSPPSAQPSTPAASPVVLNPSDAGDGVLVSVETLGGHCLAGACGGTIAIGSDGRAQQVAPEPKDLGTVPPELMEALTVEVEQADFAAIKGQPFTDTCPIAFDGQQFIYTFTVAAGSEKIDSCEVVVDPANPLFVAVDAAIASVTQS